MQYLDRDILKFKRHIQIGPYDYEGKPAQWCMQTHSADPPPIDKRVDWMISSEAIIFSYLTNNWDRLYAGGNDLFFRCRDPRPLIVSQTGGLTHSAPFYHGHIEIVPALICGETGSTSGGSVPKIQALVSAMGSEPWWKHSLCTRF